jgi:hypothetical protein
MKKRKFKEKHRSPVSGMPKRKEIKKRTPVKRKKKFTLFKKKSLNKKTNPRRRQKTMTRILGLVLILIVLGLIFISVKYVLSTRGKTSNGSTTQGYILGLDDIPRYPESTFLFEENKETDTVQNFLMSGQSAYRLPRNTSREDIHEYYQGKLVDLGWINVLSVAIGSEDMRYGEYWVKDGVGLRIYVKENSIWYETITEEEANNGLEDEVKAEVERELLLASSETQDLLPDFPWVLAVPKEYVISYHSSELGDFREVSFKKIGSNNVYTLTPVGYYGGNTFDAYLYNFIDSKNSTEVVEWGVQNSFYVTKNNREILLGDIVSPDGLRDGAVIKNDYNTLVYILVSATKDDPFFEFVLENIEAQDDHQY